MKNLFLLAVLVFAALVVPYAVKADSSVWPGDCPAVSFSATPSSGYYPLTSTLKIDAREHLRCMIRNYVHRRSEYQSPSYLNFVALNYSYGVPSIENRSFVVQPFTIPPIPTDQDKEKELQDWLDWYGVHQVDYVFPQDLRYYAKGQIDVSFSSTYVGAIPPVTRTVSLSSSWADGEVAVYQPPATVDLKADGLNGSVSKVVGESTYLTWETENVTECTSYQGPGNPVGGQYNWENNTPQPVQRAAPGTQVTFSKPGEYELGLRCNPEDKVVIKVNPVPVSPPTVLKVESNVPGVSVSNAPVGGYDDADGITNYEVRKADGAIRALLEVEKVADPPGYDFSHWVGCGDAIISYGRVCEANVLDGQTGTVTANFVNASAPPTTLKVLSSGASGIEIYRKNGPLDIWGVTNYVRSYESKGGPVFATLEAPAYSKEGRKFLNWDGCTTSMPSKTECYVEVKAGETNTITANYEPPPECPSVIFTAAPAQGASPLEVTLTLDARDFLRCSVMDILGSRPGGLLGKETSKIEASFIIDPVNYPSIHFYSPPTLFYTDNDNIDALFNAWVEKYGVYSVKDTYYDIPVLGYPQPTPVKGQVDGYFVDNYRKQSGYFSSDTTASFTFTDPPVTIDYFLANGYTKISNLIVGQSANLTWKTTNAEKCRSLVGVNNPPEGQNDWSGGSQQELNKTTPGFPVTFSKSGGYALGLSCNPTATVEVEVTEASTPKAILYVESSGASGVSIDNAVSDIAIPFYDDAAGTTNYEAKDTTGEKVINALLEAPEVAPNNYVFSSWSGCDAHVLSYGRVCRVTVPDKATATVTAKYIPPPEPLTVLTVESSGAYGVWIDHESGLPKDGGYTTYVATSTDAFADAKLKAPGTAVYGGQNYSFDKWEGCKSTSGVECVVDVPDGTEKTIKAVYRSADKAVLYVNSSGASEIEIRRGAGPENIGGFTDYRREYSYDITANLVVYSSAPVGTISTGWTECDTPGPGGSCNVDVKVGESQTVTANYRPYVATLIVRSGGVDGVPINGSPTSLRGTTSNYSYTRTSVNPISGQLVAPGTSGAGKFSAWLNCDSAAGDTCGVDVELDEVQTVTADYLVPPDDKKPACSDGADNDSDGFIDLADPGCVDASDNSEVDPSSKPACSDGIDNDGDKLIDYGNDPGCTSAGDTDETNAEGDKPACSDGIDNDNDGFTDYPFDIGCGSAAENDENINFLRRFIREL
ncbi:MAG: hypothetical protein V2A55_02270 [Candidatus Jorgensenbacteria bacterium]